MVKGNNLKECQRKKHSPEKETKEEELANSVMKSKRISKSRQSTVKCSRNFK